MSRKKKLYEKAKNSPANLRFEEACNLAVQVGFEFRNQSGSHKTYKHPKFKIMINLQPDPKDKSKAKKYQVDQLVGYIDQYKLIGE